MPEIGVFGLQAWNPATMGESLQVCSGRGGFLQRNCLLKYIDIEIIFLKYLEQIQPTKTLKQIFKSLRKPFLF